jgi:hypothetical protein
VLKTSLTFSVKFSSRTRSSNRPPESVVSLSTISPLTTASTVRSDDCA